MPHDTTRPEAPRAEMSAAPKPYAAPALTELGAVDALTAGPEGGNLDALVGASGGFQVDQTS